MPVIKAWKMYSRQSLTLTMCKVMFLHLNDKSQNQYIYMVDFSTTHFKYDIGMINIFR